MEKLLNRLPKKYHERVEKIESESGLIDDCKFMLYFDNGYTYNSYTSIPVRSITEAINFIKDTTKTN